MSFFDCTLQDNAEKILRVTAEELGKARESDVAQYNSIFSNGIFQTFKFKMRAMADIYYGETRVQHTVSA